MQAAGQPHVPKDKAEKMSDLAKERALAGTQVEKESLWPLKDDAGLSGVIKLWTEKTRWAKTQLEHDLAIAIEHNKNVCINTLATRGELRRTSILYWMQRETWQEIVWEGWDTVLFVSVSNSKTRCSPGKEASEQKEENREQNEGPITRDKGDLLHHLDT